MTSRSFAANTPSVGLVAMIDEVEQRVLDDIAKFGWHRIQVNADNQGPSKLLATVRHSNRVGRVARSMKCAAE